MTDALIIILIIIVFPIAAVWGLRAFRKMQQKPKVKKKEDFKPHVYHEMTNLILIPFGKYAWNGRNAPDGSFAKIVWQVFLIVLITVIFWFVLGLIDRRINGRDVQTPNKETAFEEDYVD